MKRTFVTTLCLAAFLLLSFLLTGCNPGSRQAPASSGAAEASTLDERVEAIMSSMTLKEKIGQMVMIGIHGTDVTEDSLFMLHQYHIGGIILFDRNMESPEQVKLLNAHLQKEAQEKLPLFIGVDEEGGLVARMKEKLPPPPSAREIGDTGNPEVAGEWAVKTAVALKGMGFNVNFAPVADVGMERGRSYSDDPYAVAAFVEEAGRGYESENLIYCLKHFPGLGQSQVDTHKDTSVVSADLTELRERDLFPFQSMIMEKDPADYFIMVSHAIYPALEDVPASVSPVVQTDLLRKELKYDGVIITDDIAMRAVANHFTPEEVALRAVRAGADIVLSCHEYQTGTDVTSTKL